MFHFEFWLKIINYIPTNECQSSAKCDLVILDVPRSQPVLYLRTNVTAAPLNLHWTGRLANGVVGAIPGRSKHAIIGQDCSGPTGIQLLVTDTPSFMF